MEITHYGGGCILVTTKQLSLLIDPLEKEYKLKLPSLKPDMVLFTASSEAGGEGFVVDSPGEYEMKNVLVKGIAAQLHIDKPEDPKRGIIYTVAANDVRLLVLGNIDPNLSDQQREAIGEVNIMVVPVGGHGLSLDANAAAKIISQFEPQYTVPVHYDDGKASYPMPQDKLDKFLHEMGGESPQAVDKLKVLAKEVGEESKLVILKPQAK